MRKFHIWIFAFVFAASFLVVTPSQAGNGKGNNGNGNGNGGNNNSLPINGGIVFLLIAGTLIGVKVVFDANKKVRA